MRILRSGHLPGRGHGKGTGTFQTGGLAQCALSKEPEHVRVRGQSQRAGSWKGHYRT